MPNNNESGKAGTITADEFSALSTAVSTYGAKLLASKVAKICSKWGEPFRHEYANSTIAAAWLSVSNKISTALGRSTNGIVNMDTFDFLTDLVATYGPEVVVQKLAKIAKKNGATSDGNMLANLFPVSSSRAA